MSEQILDSHVRYSTLPSRFVPYPIGTKLYIRLLLWEEIDYIYTYRSLKLELYEYIKRNGIVKFILPDGKEMDLDEVTVDDWSHIELAVTLHSFPDLLFNVSDSNCPKCSNNVKELSILLKEDGDDILLSDELQTPGKKDTLTDDEITKLYQEAFAQGKGMEFLNRQVERFKESGKDVSTITVQPSDLSFYELDEKIKPPVTAKLTKVGEVEVDFFRMKHYINLFNEGGIGSIQKRFSQVTGVPVTKLYPQDSALATYILKEMYHGLSSILTIKCPKCTHKYQITSDWEVSDFLPFHIDQDVERNRIHFSQRPASTSSSAPKNAVSESNINVHDLSSSETKVTAEHDSVPTVEDTKTDSVLLDDQPIVDTPESNEELFHTTEKVEPVKNEDVQQPSQPKVEEEDVKYLDLDTASKSAIEPTLKSQLEDLINKGKDGKIDFAEIERSQGLEYAHHIKAELVRIKAVRAKYSPESNLYYLNYEMTGDPERDRGKKKYFIKDIPDAVLLTLSHTTVLGRLERPPLKPGEEQVRKKRPKPPKPIDVPNKTHFEF